LLQPKARLNLHGFWAPIACRWLPLALTLAGLLCPSRLDAQASSEAAAAIRRARAFVRSHAPDDFTNAVSSSRLHAALAPAEMHETSAAASLAAARVQHLVLAASPTASNLSSPWTPVGPVQVQTSSYGLVTGRVTSIAIDPSDATNNTVYLGTSGGGVWKSRDAAGTQPSFAPLTDALPVYSRNAGSAVVPSLSIGAISVQPGGTGVVLAGTGDPNEATDSYYGSGILRSTDNGSTWSLISAGSNGSFVGEGFAGFAWSTVTPYLAVAAVSSSAESAIVKGSSTGVRGLYYSTNAGASWILATILDGSTVLQDRNTNYTNFRGNAATSVAWNPIRKKFYAAIRAHGYYESADGITWTRMANQPGTKFTAANCPTRPGDYGLLSCPIFRGALAVQPTSGDLFALTVDATNADQGLWQDACAKSGSACASSTVTWGSRIDALSMEDGSGVIPQGDYNLTLAAVPAATALSAADTLLFAGAGDLYRCTLAGGCNLRNTTNATNGCAAPAGVAPAQHAIAWGVNLANAATPTLYFGNDGGIWRSQDGVNQQGSVCSADDVTHFTNLNSALGSLAEVNSLAAHPSDPNILLAALGANGSAASTTASQASASSPWVQLGTGESGAVAVDQSSGNTWMVQSGGGVALHTCMNGSACTAMDFAGPAAVGTTQVANDRSLVDPPALLDPGLNTNLLTATCRIWRGPVLGGGTWSSSNAISPFLAGPSGSACNDADAYVRSLAAGGAVIVGGASQTSGSSVLYAGLAGGADGGTSFSGHIYRSSFANTATATSGWTDLTNSSITNDSNRFNAEGFDVSSIAVDPSDSTGSTVYATVMGFGVAHVYRSLNAGATWTNISANLPNAPANSIVVDPNSPVTVYVAMDTGVYVATDVTTCAPATGAGSCWSVLGAGLPNAPVLSLSATAGVTLPGSSSAGALRAATYGRGIWQIGLVSSGQTLLPKATFSSSSISFGAQNIGSTSVTRVVTLTNTGNAVLRIGSVGISGDFNETDTCGNAELTVNASCTVTITFSPRIAGTLNGSLQVNSNVSGGYSSLALTGTGQGVPNVILLPSTLGFADTPVNSTSAERSVTVSNTGTGEATLSMPAVTADFNVASTTCTTTLMAGATCSVSVSFRPTASALRIGTLTVADTTALHTAILFGTGTGTPAISYAPTSLMFVSGQVATTAALASLTITNAGTAPATLSAPTVTGADFSLYTNTCGTILQPAASCVLRVLFSPVAIGTRTGSLTFTDSSGTHAVPLSGSAVAAADVTAAPASLAFGTTDVNGISASQVVTFRNSGGFTYLAGEEAAGDFGIVENSCGAFLNAGAGCQLKIAFEPTSDGPRNGAVTITERSGLAHSVLLSGIGRGTPAVSVSAVALIFPTTGVGSTSAVQTVTLSNIGTAALALSPSSITGDFIILTNSCGSGLAAGASCALSIVFTPTDAGPRDGALTLTDAISSHRIPLNGMGNGTPIVTLAPTSLAFTSTPVGAPSAEAVITLSNNGTSSTSLRTASATGAFSITANTCGAAIVPGGRCSLSVRFTPVASGIHTGLFSLADATQNHTVMLSGIGTAGTLTVTPAALSFPETTRNTSSAVRSFALTNTGNGALNLSGLAVSGDFSINTNSCGTTLAVGSSCAVAIAFTPTAIGVRTGAVTILSDSTGHAATVTNVALSGIGKAAFNVVLTPAAINFGPQITGTASTVTNITISNTGTVAGTLGRISVSGDFLLRANTCGATLAPQTGCTVSVAFVPTANGARTGLLMVGAEAVALEATLTGVGIGAATDSIEPLSLNFAEQQANTASAAQSVTFTNDGDVALTLVSASVAAGDFTAVNNCGATVPAHTTCSFSVTFLPKSIGKLTGTLQITDVRRVQNVTLSGTAVAGPGVSLLPSALNFATTGVGAAGAGQALTLTNNGTVPLRLTGIHITGDFGIVAGSSTCILNASIPVGGACSLSVAFLPTDTGERTGTVSLAGNVSIPVAQLRGTGVDFSLQSAGATSQTISSGGSASYPLLLRPAVSTSDPVTYTCSGLPANARCNVRAQYSDLSAISTVTVTVLTGTTTKNIQIAMLIVPMLLCLPVSWRRRIAFLIVLTISLAGMQGCGSNRVIPGSGDGSGTGAGTTVTPSGTYNLNVSATAAGITHTVPLTLIVR
jgi:hypothetical protein